MLLTAPDPAGRVQGPRSVTRVCRVHPPRPDLLSPAVLVSLPLSAPRAAGEQGGKWGARSPSLWRGLRGSPRALGVPVSVPQAVPGRPHGDGASWLSFEPGAPSAGGSLQLQGFSLNVGSAPSTLHGTTFPGMVQAPAQPRFSGWGSLREGAGVTYLPAYTISGNAGPGDGAAPLGPFASTGGGCVFAPPIFAR